ncbi:putative cytochrome P450 [Xylariomycetidae sp. FL0641]|nr:putative cytochrome P450 [Xylariomycetidae sp. FL0641]
MASPSSTLAFIFAGLTCIVLLYSRVFRGSSLGLPPGPKALPLVGNLHQVPKSLQWLHFYEWSKKYGPIMHLSMGGQSMILLSTNQVAQDLLSRRSAQYSDRPRMVMAGELVTKGMHMLLRQYDAQYRLHQRMEAPLLNPRASSFYRPLQEIESRQTLWDLLREHESLALIRLSGYRLKTGYEQELEDGKAVQEAFSKTGQVGTYIVDTFPALNYLPKPLAPWKKEAEELYNLETKLHVKNLERGLNNPGWNFTKHMIESKEGKSMSAEELAFDLGIMADAALDTSTHTLGWFIVACITCGDGFVKKAREDLDRVVGRERLPAFEDRDRLAYIDAIVLETMRWRPVVIGGVPHATKKADTYMGYHIPAGSIVMGNHYAIGRDESVFGDHVDEFRPERWLEYTGEEYADTDTERHDHYVLKDLPQTGFGFGRRICVGRHIARHGLYIQIARLLWAFDIEPAVSEETGKKFEVDNMAFTEGFVADPMPFRTLLRPRGPWVREIIEAQCYTHDMDLAGILDQAGSNRKVNVSKA